MKGPIQDMDKSVQYIATTKGPLNAYMLLDSVGDCSSHVDALLRWPKCKKRACSPPQMFCSVLVSSLIYIQPQLPLPLPLLLLPVHAWKHGTTPAAIHIYHIQTLVPYSAWVWCHCYCCCLSSSNLEGLVLVLAPLLSLFLLRCLS